MNDEHEPIIDTLLEELLGGESPPDLKARILGARDASTDTWVDVQLGKAPPSNGSKPTEALPKVVPTAPRPEVSAASRDRRRRALQFIASAAIVVIGAGLFFGWSLNLTNQLDDANKSPVVTQVPPPPEVKITTDFPDDRNEEFADVAEDLPSLPAPPDQSLVLAESPQNTDAAKEIQIKPSQFVRTVDLEEPSSDQRIVAFVNRQLKDRWEQRSISPLPSVGDFVWFHRASRYLLGRPASDKETQLFRRSRDREDAIDKMTASDDFAKHWGGVITNVLVGNNVQRQAQRQQLQDYIANSIREGKPHDELSFELITAVGSNDPTSPDFNPATNFLLAHRAVGKGGKKRASAIKLAATDKVCQVFLGKQVQCAQCHDHNGTTQEQYHQVAAFFAQMRPRAEGNAQLLANEDFIGTANTPDEADLYFVDSEGVGVSVYPAFFGGQKAKSSSGRIQDIDRRAELAQMIVSSDEFSKATVNRLWKHALGNGFTRPVDDMGDHNRVTHPKLLDRLATEFKNSEYDIKSTLKWIALSSAFDRDERRTAGPFDSFASFARRDNLTFPAIRQGLQRIAKARAAGKFDQLLAQEGAAGKQISSERKAREMERISGRLKEKLLRNTEGSLLARLANNDNLTDGDRISHLFWTTVGRAPRNQELYYALQMLKHGSKATGMQDVGWILLNSEEFVTQH